MVEHESSDEVAWKQRFRVSTVSAVLASGNPARGLASSNRSGTTQLYAWEVATGTLRQLTGTAAGRGHGTLSGDGEWLYYLDDAAGNELGHYVRVPFGGGEPQDITPDMPLYSSFGFDTSNDGQTLAFNTADASGFAFYVAGADTNAPRRFFQTPALTFGPKLSSSGEWAVVATTEGMQGVNTRLLVFTTADGTQIAALSDADSSVQPAHFCPLPGDPRLLATSDVSGASRPLLWNVQNGERTELALNALPGDIRPLAWSPDGARLLLQHVAEASQQLYRYNLADHSLHKLEHPSGTFFGAFFNTAGHIVANWQSSTSPAQVVLLDGTSGQMRETLLPAGSAPASQAWRSVRFRSADGQQIQGWLATPEGAGPFPTILETHGGPEYALTDLYHAASQAWLDHGFAFLSINYRGSTTFGRAFSQKIWGDLGHWEVEDMVAAREWLVENGIADPARILLTGWSYGGYLTLLALGKRPELWAGGMAGVAIADWSVQYEDTADTLRGYQVALLGGTPQQVPAVYAAASPITYADAVAAPVLIIQGRNDTRCPPRPVRNYEARLRERGAPIEVEWFDAGHGSNVVDQSIEHQERMLAFAQRIIGE